MNKKTVKRVIDKKHEDFLASITDEEVRKLVEENSFITGGSIVSLLTNEPVVDYDYYFTNKETCKKVAEYYVEKFKETHPDTDVSVQEDGDRVKIVVPSLGVAGDENEGFQETAEEVIADADNIDAEQLNNMDEDKEKYRPVFLSANAITLSDKVQLVIRFHGEPEEVHKNYDFVHCTNYWQSKGKKLVLNQPALESILAKTLYYQGSLYPLCSVIRTRKFIKRGWHINAGQFLKMLFQVSELNLTDLTVLEEQLTGVDALYFYQVIDYCKQKQEKDPTFKITPPYLASIIDKIF